MKTRTANKTDVSHSRSVRISSVDFRRTHTCRSNENVITKYPHGIRASTVNRVQLEVLGSVINYNFNYADGGKH